MKEYKAIYHNGGLQFLDPAPDLDAGPIEVTVLFPEEAEDPWQPILDDPTPRPKLMEWVREVEEEIAQGKVEPLDLDKL